MELRTSVVIAMAHRLAGHEGLCRNLHGHNWTITAHISIDTDELIEHLGYVVEFGTLRKQMRNVLEPFDHSVVLQERDKLIPALEGHRVHVLNVPPSTEHLAALFYRILDHMLRAEYSDRSVRIEYVELVETPNNTVTAFSGGEANLV